MMKNYPEFYRRLTTPLLHHPWTISLLRAANKLVVWVMYVAYFIILAWVGAKGWTHLLPFLIIPGIGFILLSLFRQLINAPRPYERYAITPLISRVKTGDSMPSRHVFSATVIAMCGLRLNFTVGCILLVLAIISGITRVLGGVHFPRDVVMGFLSGLLCGLILFMF